MAHARYTVSAALLVLLSPSFVGAQVTQPNGNVVPVDSGAAETQLDELFSSRGESIDFVADARRTPDTFSPLCDFTASFVLNEAGNVFGVGWYNVDPSATAPPAGSEIYEVVPAGSPLGTTIDGASIRDDPNYAGGLIGFALLRSPPHFTEARWNTVCDSGPCSGSPGPWVLSLTYLSTVTPNAWYVAFEDGDTTSSSWNNDGDYNDDVFFFTGIACAGAGATCTVEGADGICANGLTECGTGGVLTCRQVNTPTTEVCDAVDNNCDGSIDEGDALCPVGEVCDRGICVAPCFEGGCAADQTCADGLCVDTACLETTCPSGERCVAGECVGACEGVVCPGATECRGGRCVDLCAGVTCDEGRVCDGGVCVEACDCRPCGAGFECASTGSCVEDGCAGVTCSAGEVCRAGSCVDACDGAVCPSGQVCAAGECVDDSSGGSDAGPGGDGDGGTGTGMDGGAGGMDGGDGAPTSGGCGCRVAERARGTGAALMLALFGLLLVRRSRRRR